MSCSTCIKVNPVPACSDSDTFNLTGITFPNNVDDTINVVFLDIGTGREILFQADVDGSGIPDLNIKQFQPLDDRWYRLTFYNLDGSPATATVTNPDLTTDTGCCVEFKTHQGMVGETEWILTTSGCEVGA